VTNDRPSITTLYREHIGYIRWIIGCRGVPAAHVDDVAQEVLEAVERYYHTYNPTVGELRCWLASIARRKASSYLQHRGRDDHRLVDIQGEYEPTVLLDPAPNPEEAMMLQDEGRFVHEILARMPKARREAFELHAIGGLPDSAVAQELSASENTVKSWIRLGWEDVHRAVEKRQAQERRLGSKTGLLSAAMLIARERVQIESVPEEVQERIWARFLRSREEAEPQLVPAMDRPSIPREWLPPRQFPGRTLVQACSGAGLIGAGGGGAIVWALLQGAPSPAHPAIAIASAVVASAIPNGRPMAPPATGAGAAAPPVIPASLAAAPFSVPPSPTALPAASRPTTPAASHPIGAEDTEEGLLQAAQAALSVGDVDRARAVLEHHAQDFPEGRLRLAREALRRRLSHQSSKP
jgi:RNA polymerase sigma-70 factor (ECF subfamily)